MNRRLAPVLGLAVLFLAAACGAAGKSPAATPSPSQSPSARAVPRITMPSGAVYEVEVARTPDEQAQGLMFRESLREKTGMIFLFPDSAVHKFWMKNTMIPLDMIWLDSTGKVLFVSANTPPCKADPCPNYGPDVPASSVLEIEGGKAIKEGIKPGTVLKFVDVR
jgi:uncharacterized membrane protein (UPF0127 family)